MKNTTSQSQRRENQPDQPSSGAPGNEPYKTHQGSDSASDPMQIRTGPVASKSGVVAPNIKDQAIPGNRDEAKKTVRAGSNNADKTTEKLSAPSHDRNRSENPGAPVDFVNGSRGSMSGQYETNHRGWSGSQKGLHETQERTDLDTDQGHGYSSPWSGK